MATSDRQDRIKAGHLTAQNQINQRSGDDEEDQVPDIPQRVIQRHSLVAVPEDPEPAPLLPLLGETDERFAFQPHPECGIAIEEHDGQDVPQNIGDQEASGAPLHLGQVYLRVPALKSIEKQITRNQEEQRDGQPADRFREEDAQSGIEGIRAAAAHGAGVDHDDQGRHREAQPVHHFRLQDAVSLAGTIDR